jgi:hypothetical protein
MICSSIPVAWVRGGSHGDQVVHGELVGAHLGLVVDVKRASEVFYVDDIGQVMLRELQDAEAGERYVPSCLVWQHPQGKRRRVGADVPQVTKLVEVNCGASDGAARRGFVEDEHEL